MRLIDMKKVLSELCLSHKDIIYIDKNETAERIKKIQSIDIVRCGECKHWNEEDHWCNIRDSYGWDYKADDYCSYGVKKGADDD